MLVGAGLMFAFTTAFGQGIYVQPTSYEISAKAGNTYDMPLELRNNHSSGSDVVDMKIIYLSQDLSGYQGIEQEKMTSGDLQKFPSCLSWIRLQGPTHLTLQALSKQSVVLRVTVPNGVKGFFGAVLEIDSKDSRPTTGLKTIFRFIIPILFQIEGSSAKKQGVVVDGAAGFSVATKTRPAGTLVSCMVKNGGNVLARYSGTANLFQLINGRKRKIITANFDERRIIPNATVALSFFSPKPIPSGTYRIESAMVMEGIKLPAFSKDIEVLGDPSVKNAAADIEMSISPDPLQFDVVSGATRGLPFKVQNSGADPIVVDAIVSTPRSMVGVVGPLGTSDSFTLEPWCTQPITGVTINPGQERTLRILVSIPEGKLPNPYYFGELTVSAKSLEGVPVGSSSITMIARCKGVDSLTSIKSESNTSLAQLKPNIYGFTTPFRNFGNADIQPEFDAKIMDQAGLNPLMGLDAGESPKHILPLQPFRSNGTLDASLLKPGIYLLQVSAKVGAIGETKTTPIKVSLLGSEHIVTIFDPNAEQKQRPPKKTTKSKKGTK